MNPEEIENLCQTIMHKENDQKSFNKEKPRTRGLISKVYKELVQLSSKLTVQFKNGQRIWINIFLREDIQMAKRCMKRCSTLQVIRELQIKTAMRYHSALVGKGIIKKARENKCYWDCEQMGTLVNYWWECKLVQPLWKTYRGSSRN